MCLVSEERLSAELVAVTTAMVDGVPSVLTARGQDRLPSGPLTTDQHSMQAGLRAWVGAQTGHRLGFVEQLYTFADAGRGGSDERVISVCYLGLTSPQDPGEAWRSWYAFFPWEDRRDGDPDGFADLVAALRDWADRPSGSTESERRGLRAAVTFGLGGRAWHPELALQRYELLYEAHLVPESPWRSGTAEPAQGREMASDHRRILATAISRLRTKIQYRPVVFELMPHTFSLGQLQLVVEALGGQPVHKQNFRRLVQQQDLVEVTGGTVADTGGRPAMEFRFRREVVDERRAVGTRLPLTRLT